MIRSKARKKTVGIEVRHGEVVVRAPVRTSDADIARIVAEKQSWIQRAMTNLSKQTVGIEESTDAFWYQGRRYRLNVVPAPHAEARVVITPDAICVQGAVDPLDARAIRMALYDWYRKEAASILPRQLAVIAADLGYHDYTVRVKEQRSRWGSCSVNRNINLNWRLIMAPVHVAKYVMVHELCHLKEMNHSERFWSLVKNAMPDYERARKWLREEAPAKLHWVNG